MTREPSLPRSCRLLLAGLSASVLALVFTACATTGIPFDEPSLELVSVEPLPAEGFAQRFRLGFSLRNPNGSPLDARGMAYEISLEGHKLLSGVTNEIPEVGGYEEVSFDIVASTSLLGSLRLIEDLFNQPRERIEYRLQAKLELASPVSRKVKIEEVGEFSFKR